MTELGVGGDINIVAEVESAAEQVEDAIEMGRSLLKLVGNLG
jgi:hypothetical protein